MPADDILEQIAALLDRPAHTLVLLDQRPLRLLLVPGSYLTVTLRDKVSREILEPTLDLTNGSLVDAPRLRAADIAAADEHTSLSPGLRSLLRRRPDTGRAHRGGDPLRGTPELFTGDPAQVLALGRCSRRQQRGRGGRRRDPRLTG